jgi:hypothetical protein
MEAKTTADVVRWVRDNKHYEGWWSGSYSAPTHFTLRGKNTTLVIPAAIHDPEAIEPDDFATTGRMYRPSAKGLALLEDA